MKIIVSFLTVVTILFSSELNYNKTIDYFKSKNYLKCCKLGSKIYYKYSSNFASMVGIACAKTDNINILGDIIKRLYKTKFDRTNASYFVTLIFEKKLLYQFVLDKISLKNLSLPKTKHILSRVFEKISSGNYKYIDGKIVIQDKEYKYVIWSTNGKKRVMIIDEYKNGILIKHHWYI